MDVRVPEVLRVRAFGLPRWVWLAAIGSGLIIGIYLRSRRNAEVDEEVPVEDEGYFAADAEGQYSPAFGIGGYGGGGYTGDATVGSTYEDYLGSSMELADRMIEIYQRGIDTAIGLFPSYDPIAPPVDNGGAQYIPDTYIPDIPDVGGGGAPTAPAPMTQVPSGPSPAQQAEQRRQQEQQRKRMEEQRKRMEEQTIRARVDQAMSVRTDPKGKYRGKLAHVAAGRDRSRIETSARRHPNWGPYTLAWGRVLDGHSMAF